MAILDPKDVPSGLFFLLPFVEKWGIGDDFERELAVRSASKEELYLLVHSTDDISDEALYGWLGGPESFNLHPSPEYVAFSNFAMAIDSAKARIRKME